MDDVLHHAGGLSGKVILTCSLPMDAGNTGLVIGRTTSGAEEFAKKVPKAKIVCAFNTVPSEVFFGVYAARRKADRASLVYCGDDARSKEVAAVLIRDVGFEPVDAGPLRIARYTEPFALLMGQLAYEGNDGPGMGVPLRAISQMSGIMHELAGWDSFYVIVGSAAGALIGLQFVVMTLIAERPPIRAAEAGAAFATPTIVHFGAVLLLSAFLHAPWPTIIPAAALWGVMGCGGAVYIVIVARRMRKQAMYQAEFEDWLFHVLLPLAATRSWRFRR